MGGKSAEIVFEKEAFLPVFEDCMAQEDLAPYAVAPYAARFADLTALLIEANQTMNLTAIREPGEICLKHYADCLKLAALLPEEGGALLDVGCGGGFPTLPLAIVRPDLRFTALDSTAKKLRFVERCAEALSLPVVTMHARAEEAAHEAAYREQFDLVTARAVARLMQLSQWCLPFVRIGGVFLAMKGGGGDEELEEARPVIAAYGGEVEDVSHFLLGDMERTVIKIRKIAPTPSGYPKKHGKKK